MAVALDFETTLIKDAEFSPRPICLSRCESGSVPGLVVGRDMKEIFIETLKSETMATANGAFDLCVAWHAWPEIFPDIMSALVDNRIQDVLLRQKLIDISNGNYRGYFDEKSSEWKAYGYSLAALSKRHLDLKMDKDTWRLRYEELEHIPLEQ